MAQTVKNLPAVQETQVQSLGQEDPLEKRMATHSIILAGERQRSLVGYSPQGGKDTTEQLTHTEKFLQGIMFKLAGNQRDKVKPLETNIC